ncbi:MAG: acyl carrier protein [Cyclobacteriaceae bacterium]
MKPVELDEIITFLKQVIARETKLDVNKIEVDQHLGVFGLDSINSVYVLQQLEDFLQLELSPLLFWDYPTIKSLSIHLYQLKNNGNEQALGSIR